jgi:hypothetical protein
MNSTFKAEIIAKIPKVNTLILLVMALLLFLLTPILSTGKVMLGIVEIFMSALLLAQTKTKEVRNLLRKNMSPKPLTQLSLLLVYQLQQPQTLARSCA